MHYLLSLNIFLNRSSQIYLYQNRVLPFQQFDLGEDSYELLLSDRQHNPLPTANLNDENATLIERDWPDGPITNIPRNEWSFARWADGEEVRDANFICLPKGFKSGKV